MDFAIKKNKRIKILLVPLLLVQLLTTIGCSKQSAYDTIIEYLRSSANLELQVVDINIGKITYLNTKDNNSKDKKIIILLHGLASDKDSWLQFSKYIPSDYRVIIPDLPAHGDSVQVLDLNYSIENQAIWLHKFISKLGIKKANIVGLSMGGAVAMRYDYMYPESVSSLTLIDSHGAIKTASVVDKIYKETGKMPMLEIYNRDDFDFMMKLAMENPPYIPGFMADVIIKNRLKRKKIDSKILKDAYVDFDQSKILSKIKVKTLILWGANDKVIHVDSATFLDSEIPDTKKIIIKNAGHVIVVEKPELVANYFLNFIKDQRIN